MLEGGSISNDKNRLVQSRPTVVHYLSKTKSKNQPRFLYSTKSKKYFLTKLKVKNEQVTQVKSNFGKQKKNYFSLSGNTSPL